MRKKTIEIFQGLFALAFIASICFAVISVVIEALTRSVFAFLAGFAAGAGGGVLTVFIAGMLIFWRNRDR